MPQPSTDPSAGREVRLIAIARRELQARGVLADDDHYRQVMADTCGGKRSAKDLTPDERRALLDKLGRMGFRVKQSSKPKAAGQPRRVRTLDLSAEGRKVRALWLFMHTPLGLVRDSSEAALGAYVKRMTGVEALQWTNGEQIKTVIEGLKKWAMRELQSHVTARRFELTEAIKAAGRQPTDGEAMTLALGSRFYNQAYAAHEALGRAIERVRAEGASA